MEGVHEVLYAEKPAGKAEVLRQGLYYSITCRCRIGNGEVCRLIVSWSDGWENLGVPVPESDGFILRRKIPAKHIGEGEVRFRLIPIGQDVDEILFPRVTQLHEEKTETPAGQQQQGELPQEQIAEERPLEELPRKEEPSGGQSLQPELLTEDEGGRVPILEDVPFEPLDRLERASLGFQDGQAVAVFHDPEDLRSDVKLEPDGTVV